MTYGNLVPTEDSILISAAHGRQRRAQRKIDKVDLQSARRYGMKENARDGRIKYTYGGVVFIYDPNKNREVTSWKSVDSSSHTSGTKCAKPIILPKKEEFCNESSIQEHELIQVNALKKKTGFTSHSVLIVDMSGSMRRDDINGARCRSDGVWMVLARDYVKKPLENKTRTNKDLVSIIIMQDTAELVICCEPIGWVLYNKLIEMREWHSIRPKGPGNYIPALDIAEYLLRFLSDDKCALALLFFSDGRPSDKGNFAERMGGIASKFGRRLSVSCIGMADQSEDFSILSDMVKEAESYGSIASFGKPSLDTDSLSNLVTSLATSLTSSKTEMTDVCTGKSRSIRTDLRREKQRTGDGNGFSFGEDDEIYLSPDEWRKYDGKSVLRVWSWNYRLNIFAEVFDSRCAVCWKETELSMNGNATIERFNPFVCPDCRGVCFCSIACYIKSRRNSDAYHKCGQTRRKVKKGHIVNRKVQSHNVAMKEKIFGEGAERVVHRFRYLNEFGLPVGKKMVAKESRFVEEKRQNYDERMDYHSEFMRTQAIASEMAKKFNDAIDELIDHFERYPDFVAQLPRIHFLEPFVFEVNDCDAQNEEYNILVEPYLDGKYEKFNNNMGYVKGQKNVNNLSDCLEKLNLGTLNNGLGLDIIEEDEEYDSDDEIFEEKNSDPVAMSYSNVRDEDFPQAFSHYSYEKSKKKLMVVDLQGVFHINDDKTRCYTLTDPVIHKKESSVSKWNFGRTDRGRKGMNAFFQTHKCSEVCKLLGLTPIN